MRKAIKGFEGLYEVDVGGNVYSLRKGIRLKPNILNSGYAQYCLNKNGKRLLVLGHRLVAEQFIPNPNNYPIVNHKDENKLNNAVENLEWCTYSYNLTYGSLRDKHKAPSFWSYGVEKSKKPVLQIQNNQIINCFESVSEAGRKTNTNISDISQCCLGNRKRANKFKWKFKEENSYADAQEI